MARILNYKLGFSHQPKYDIYPTRMKGKRQQKAKLDLSAQKMYHFTSI
jgi:hypothetical protein